MHSTSRGETFVGHPSLNTAINDRVKIYGEHHKDDLIAEVERVHQNGDLVNKHIAIMSENNSSGISLHKVISLQITLVKIND